MRSLPRLSVVVSSFCLLCCLQFMFSVAVSDDGFPDYYKTTDDIPIDLRNKGLSINPKTNEITITLFTNVTRSNPLNFAFVLSPPAGPLIFTAPKPDRCFQKSKYNDEKFVHFRYGRENQCEGQFSWSPIFFHVQSGSAELVAQGGCKSHAKVILTNENGNITCDAQHDEPWRNSGTFCGVSPSKSDYSDLRYHLNFSIWTDSDCQLSLIFDDTLRLHNGYNKLDVNPIQEKVMKSNTRFIVGIVVATIVFLVFLIGGTVYWFLYRPRASRELERKKQAKLQKVSQDRSPSLKAFDQPSARVPSQPEKYSVEPQEAMPSMSSQGNEQKENRQKSKVVAKSPNVPYIEPLMPASFGDRTSEDGERKKVKTSELFLDRDLDETQDSLSVDPTQGKSPNKKKSNLSPRIKTDRHTDLGRKNKMAADECMPKKKKNK